MRRTTPAFLAIPLFLVAAMSGCGEEGNASSSVAESNATRSTGEGPAAGSVATSLATSSPTPGTARIPVVSPEDRTGPFVMTPVGIGPFRLGDEADAIIASMNEIFGKPSEDTGWDESQAACVGIGDRNRYVTWGRASMTFAEGPTLLAAKRVQHLISYLVFDDLGPKMPEDRFVLDDGQPALGRSKNEMTSWNPNVEFAESEIEGPVWFVSMGPERRSGSLGDPTMSGSFAPPDGGVGAARTRSVRAGLICVD